MSEVDGSLIDTINQIIDKSDPTQKAISLLAVLIDSRLKYISKENSEQHTELSDRINEILTKQENHETRIQSIENKKICPLGVDTKHDQMKKDLEIVLFFSEYPKITILVALGIVVLCSLGVDKLIDIVSLFAGLTGK